MSTDSHANAEALAESVRESSSMGAREVASAVVGTAIFASATAGSIALSPPSHLAVAPTVLCLLVLLAAQRVRIDTPYGFTLPTQLGFVPLLFVAPVAVVPLLVWTAMMIGATIDVARGRLKAGRLVHTAGNCAFALGPVAVFVIAGQQPARAGTAVLIAALAAQFTADFCVYTLRQTIDGDMSLSQQLRDSWVYAVDAALSWVGLVVARRVESSPVTVLSLVPLLAVLGTFARERRKRLESMLELGNAYRGTALLLGDVVEADDGYTGEHCKDVLTLALRVGSEVGLGPDRQRNLEFGALLHDVGKIAIPKEIINKPGKLDAREYAVVKSHAVEGQHMLDRIGGFMRDVGLIVRFHHERWDGRGYPDGLAGDTIPLEARIIAGCDAWNAMRTDRAYRKALSFEAAMAELVAGAGTQFDPRVVKALVRVLQRDDRVAAPGSPVAAPPQQRRQAVPA